MTATDLSRLLRAVLESPGDDDVRLIYADALDEAGDADRAEFIRDQVLGKPGSADWDLLDANLEAWCPWFARHDEFGFARLPDFGIRVPHFGGEATVWRRGFVSTISLPADAFLDHAREIFAAHPVTAVTLTDREPVEIHRQHRADPWTFPISDRPGHRDAIPWAVFEAGGNREWHPTRKTALDWLSSACVAWGRSQAGLPPLEGTR